MTLLKELVTVDDLIVPRLPPEHHHDWADTTISVLEDALNQPGFCGVETLPDMIQFIRQLFSNSKSYGTGAVVVNMQLANYDFSNFFDGHVDGRFEGFGKPRVWRYSRHPMTKQPMAQFKERISDKATFYQDEWGPWDEHYVNRTNEFGELERDVRVLRSKPNGAPFMLSYPDVSKDPGLQEWKTDDDWSRKAVFDALLRTWNYSNQPLETATSKQGSKDSWQALSDFYASHQTSDTLPPMPIKLTTPKGETVELSGFPCAGGWDAMWRKLKQFNPPPPDATNATPAASPAVAASSRETAVVRGPHVPRASDVNRVHHSNFGRPEAARDAASELLSEDQLWDKVTNTFSTVPNLFWVAIPHFEGELRVGLGRIALNVLASNIIDRNNDVKLSVDWYQRKAFKPSSIDKTTGAHKGFFWGQQPTFERSMTGYTASRAPVYETSGSTFGNLLPIAVTLTGKCSNSDPKPEQKCISALLKYCKE